MVPRPTSPYGASKLAGEAYCSAFAGSYGLPTVALRFSNVYGPYSYHKGSVVAAFCKRALAGEPLVVYGDGTQTRDFVFVDDLCRGIAAAVTDGGSGRGRAPRLRHRDDRARGRRAWWPSGSEAVPVEHRPARVGDVAAQRLRHLDGPGALRVRADGRAGRGLDRTVAWFRESGG